MGSIRILTYVRRQEREYKVEDWIWAQTPTLLFVCFLIIYLFLFLLLAMLSLCYCTGFLQLQREDTSIQVWCTGFSLWWLLSRYEHSCVVCELSSCGIWLSQLQHVEFSWTRDRTCVPCITGHILNHWTAREAPSVVCPDASPLSLLYQMGIWLQLYSLQVLSRSVVYYSLWPHGL